MGDIYDASGHKMAKIGQDGIVYNTAGVRLGKVLDNGEVHNSNGIKIGRYDGNGYVYEGVNRIGALRENGKVYDYDDHYVGKVIGDHEESGGAALLLLVR